MDALSAILSLLSGSRYYVNVIFFNFITLIGILRLYLFFINLNPSYKTAFFLILFFFPPFVFWTSGFHRDGLLVSALGFFLFNLQMFLSSRKVVNLLIAFASVGLMLFMRSFWGVSSLIVAIIWLTIINSRQKRIFIALSILFLIFLLFLFGHASRCINILNSLVEKQQAFLSLHGNSELPMTRLSKEPMSFLMAFLDGMRNLLFKPSLNQISKSPLYFLVFLENCFVELLFCGAIFYSIKKRIISPLSKVGNNMLLLLVLINYSIIGVTVPFLGAIVRYKAPFEILLIMVLVQFIPIKSLNKLITLKI
ncbi:hypothetical protein [Arachidicoccus terrestris]|uniref:hypothetical protein n=1 Tax=Arachidicoccus terrestris TaxID=2875539 RepID=UPI001CC38FBE|nr:hypothetical protein [Arachidicoccus terrestris]UAY55454.1 hypothetical protein K9M52_18965 [Arachidicoccus terrestris]